MEMINREKVINALERCINGCDDECPYEYGGAVTLEYCRDDLMRDTLELLKEQEPVKPMDGWLCGQCGCRIYQDANYCYNCGRKVKWDAAD